MYKRQVLNHETFREGKCYTTFIEDTPELFLLPESQDRATKILEFLGNKMVNVQKAVLDKPDFEARTLPKYDTEKKIYCLLYTSINYEDGVQQVLLNGEHVNGLISTAEVGHMASKTSAYK